MKFSTCWLCSATLLFGVVACSTDEGGTQDAGWPADGLTQADTDDTSPDVASIVDAGPAPKRPQSTDKIAIAGVWESAFGGNETILDNVWQSFGSDAVVKFDNAKRFAITQTNKDSKHNPNKFNKIVWTAPKTAASGDWQTKTIYYCIVDFGQDSLKLAEETTKTVDDSNPDKAGCGDFGLTKLSSIETIGDWKTNFSTDELITGSTWSFAWLRAFENGENWAITQNPSDAQYGPGTFNKIVWTEPKAGKWWYCTVDFGLETLDAAKKSSQTADDKDPAKSGCGNYPWTQMNK
jgi:hypothetical protein